jgi:predicted DNA-binding WGR domain protein
MELHRVDPTKNCRRGYRLHETRTLFGETALIIEWGRLGQRFRSRSEVFPSDALRAQRSKELLARRRRHGYTPVP